MFATRLARRGGLVAVLALSAAPVFVSAASATPTPPASPVLTQVVSGNRVLTPSWTEATAGVLTFKATATSTGHATHSCVTHAKTCHIVSLINGVTYSVTVTASDVNGHSAPSAAMTATVGVPLAPLSVHAFASKGGSATVFWAPPLASGVAAITGYTASASSTTDGPFTCSTSGARTCKITGLTKGLVYKITVTATNKNGTSPASKAFSLTAK